MGLVYLEAGIEIGLPERVGADGGGSVGLERDIVKRGRKRERKRERERERERKRAGAAGETTDFHLSPSPSLFSFLPPTLPLSSNRLP